VCERDRERDRERQTEIASGRDYRSRERERERVDYKQHRRTHPVFSSFSRSIVTRFNYWLLVDMPRYQV